MNSLFPKPEPRPFPVILKEARERLGLTKGDVTVKILATSPDLYDRWECGQSIPGQKWILKLAKELSIPCEELRQAVNRAKQATEGAR